MTISTSSIAAGISTVIKQASFAPDVSRMPRRPVLIGSYDSSKTAITADTEYLIVSPEQAGELFGFGFELHRMVRAFMRVWGNSALTVIPVAETSVQATIEVSITGTASETKRLNMYIAGDAVPVTVTNGQSGTDIVIAAAAAITANKDLPVTAAPNGVTPTQLDLTVKSEGVWGNYVTAEFNLGLNEDFPTGLTVSTTYNDDGVGTPDITDALNVMGTGANQNQNWYTCLVHNCLLDSTSLDLISAYNGSSELDPPTGNHDGEIGRFFQAVTGDVTAGSAGYTALKAITDNRKDDMTNSVVWRPGSPNHPTEIACVAVADREKKAIDKPEKNYVNDPLPGIWSGDDTDDYNGNANLDLAVKAGISTTKKNGTSSLMQDFVTMYRPDSVSVTSNIWRSMRHQAVLQNVSFNNNNRFSSSTWENITIVSDASKVTDITAKQSARDKQSVAGELISLLRGYMKIGFLFDDQSPGIKSIVDDIDSYVQIRPGGKGFNYIMPMVISGEGGNIVGVVQADANTGASEV